MRTNQSDFLRLSAEGALLFSPFRSLGDMSRMRLVAATSWLKIAHFQFYAEVIEVGWYQSMSYVMCVRLVAFPSVSCFFDYQFFISALLVSTVA